MMAEFAKRGKTVGMRELMGRLEEKLHSRFARPVDEMTLGRFMRLIASVFAKRKPWRVCPAWA